MPTADERIARLEERLIAHDEVHRLESVALNLQQREYERRLTGLNNEYARIAARDQFYAPRERLENVTREFNDKLEVRDKEVDRRMKDLEAWRNRAMGAAVILTLMAGALGAGIVKAFGG